MVGGGATQARAHKGVPLASVGASVASHVYADASSEVGWAAWTVPNGELL